MLIPCFLVLVWPGSGPIPISERIDSVHSMTTIGQHLFAVDSYRQILWKLDRAGTISGQYQRKGMGPGEFQQLNQVRSFEHLLFLPDLLKRAVIVLDQNLQFQKEIPVKGLCRDVLVTSDSYYFVYWEAKSGNMIHRFSKQMTHQGSFGTALTEKDLLGMQSGRLFLFSDTLFFFHNFIPVLEAFDTNGSLLYRKALPGFRDPFVSSQNLTDPMNHPIRYTLLDGFVVENYLGLKLRDSGESKSWIYLFDPQSRTFKGKKPCPKFTVSDQMGTLFEVVKNDADEAITLKPIKEFCK